MLSSLIKRRTKPTGPQCPERSSQRKIVFCDWGWHGRSNNDGWCFTYIDEAEFDAEEDLRCYKRTKPDDCAETLCKFASSQLRKNSNLKGSKGWRFVCLIEDGNKHTLPVHRRDRTPRTMLLFERNIPCPCAGRQHSLHDSKDPQLGMSIEIESARTYNDDDIPTSSPRHRRRYSSLATLYEDDAACVQYKK